MPAKHSRHIALTAPLAAFVAAQVETGEYSSASDLIRTAIRLLMVQGQAEAGHQASRLAAPPEGHDEP